ncbi:MAG: hypothetical protein ACRC62_28935 [Microcoleus sp.]
MPKIPKGTPRVTVSFGKRQVSTKVAGKKTKITVELQSRVFKTVADALKLPQVKAAPAGSKVKNIKTKGGIQKKILTGSTLNKGVSSKYVEMTTGSLDATGKDQGDMIWHRIPVHGRASLSYIVAALTGSSVYAVRWPNGNQYVISDKRFAEKGGRLAK